MVFSLYINRTWNEFIFILSKNEINFRNKILLIKSFITSSISYHNDDHHIFIIDIIKIMKR